MLSVSFEFLYLALGNVHRDYMRDRLWLSASHRVRLLVLDFCFRFSGSVTRLDLCCCGDDFETEIDRLFRFNAEDDFVSRVANKGNVDRNFVDRADIDLCALIGGVNVQSFRCGPAPRYAP